jgi:hypothetical protein
MKNYTFLALLLAGRWLPVAAQVQSPVEFLPHPYGQAFTPHHLLVDYLEHVATESPRVSLKEYGTSYERRPLLLAAISTPENLARLEEIRLDHLRRSGILEGDPQGAPLAVVWLSYGVHGNEAGASESSMDVLYQLATNERWATYLENTVVLLDPAINPDGYNRYTNWHRQVANKTPDPNPGSGEHLEPWPGGRVNHYLFDLNRDWAWATQQETRHRMQEYHRWYPHVHVDVHEQYPDDHYYFAPAARPLHACITDWQRQFQTEIGKNNATYFDAEGWLYFTKEFFDLFYPSYGDTYPTFNGAIGMTYEQAGHGHAGRAYEMENGDTLTLQDRIDHHRTTSLSTVEMASRNMEPLVKAFSSYFADAKKGDGPYEVYVIAGENGLDQLKALADFLDLHGIEYGQLENKGAAVDGFVYQTGKAGTVAISPNDLIIPAGQPAGKLLAVLFEPEPFLEDSMTYDITAWAIPFAWGLDAVAGEVLKGWKIDQLKPYDFPAFAGNPIPERMPYAILAPIESVEDVKFLGALHQAGVKLRRAQKDFSLEGEDFSAGTLVITREDNRKGSRFHEKVIALANQQERPLTYVSTGFVSDGPDLGSAQMVFLDRPQVLLVGGESTDPNRMGEVWYYFEQVIDYPLATVPFERLNRIELSDYDVIIFPNGGYQLDGNMYSEITEWVQAGGRLVAIETALRTFAGREGWGLQKRTGNTSDEEDTPPVYGDQIKNYISQSLAGAITKVEADQTHPLTFGMSNPYFSLKTNTEVYEYVEGGWTPGYLGEEVDPIGFVGYRLLPQLPKSMVFGQKPLGRGSVIYLVDNPLFRGFWTSGGVLFGNAVFGK